MLTVVCYTKWDYFILPSGFIGIDFLWIYGIDQGSYKGESPLNTIVNCLVDL